MALGARPVPRCHHCLTDGDAAAREQVELLAVLHHPPSRRELGIDQDAGLLFGGDADVVGHMPESREVDGVLRRWRRPCVHFTRRWCKRAV